MRIIELTTCMYAYRCVLLGLLEVPCAVLLKMAYSICCRTSGLAELEMVLSEIPQHHRATQGLLMYLQEKEDAIRTQIAEDARSAAELRCVKILWTRRSCRCSGRKISMNIIFPSKFQFGRSLTHCNNFMAKLHARLRQAKWFRTLGLLGCAVHF